MSNLVHFRSIEKVRVENLTSLEIISESSCLLTREPDFKEINIFELVGVTIEDSYENHQKIYTTTATFKTCDKEPIVERMLAFRVTSLDGKRFLIGTNARPYPIIKERNPYPEKPTDSTLKTVTVTWKAIYPMLLIIE